MAETTATGTDQTVAIRPGEKTEQTVAIRPSEQSEQTMPVKQETPTLPSGYEDLGATWWCAVAKVHEALLSEAEFQTVCEVFDAELRARWEYAKTLHQAGYEVPEYLTEHAPVAPLWPLPPLPELAGDLADAA
ncbi:MAG: hypothetical protein GEU94_20070 [Micromonosporaceae bacterium]|nr:hypothetical protein [Micromonosporaceae bacterium]